jgi:uncharacterized protein (TIGR00255 family)
MASSMTGFGRGESAHDERRITVEIKSVNNRFCDIQVRQPRILAALETRVREMISQRLGRGKIDVFINFEDNSEDACRVHCDLGLAKAYAAALREVAHAIDAPDSINASTISRFNDVLRVESTQVEPEAVWTLLAAALGHALDNISVMRHLEGDKLGRDILEKTAAIRQFREQVALRAPQVPAEYRQRLKQRIDELLGEQARQLFDEQRLAAEVAIYADKCAIDEELVRLGSHLDQLDMILAEDGAIGKKLDFLMQEINREINTIGSKANDLELVQCVVQMKSELEKIREQVQNIE